MDWGSVDWSQIEYRMLVHFAVLLKAEGADIALQKYLNDKRTDFHKLAAEITNVPRKKAKNINFGVVYGMGVPTMAANLGCSISEADKILNEFHIEMPFLKSTFQTASNRASARGEIRTILGRKRRWTQYEFMGKIYQSLDDAEKVRMEMIDKKETIRGRPRRAFTHKALNALLQGSNADLMKKAMVEMYEAGLFEVLVPHLTVHDEMNASIPRTKEGKEAFGEMVNIMENSIKLLVPVLADATIGANWGEAKDAA